MKAMNQQSHLVIKKRDYSLDKIRGFAVVIMVIFHGAYDLNAFRLVHINFHSGFWYWFPRFIAMTFLFCVGISLEKAYAKKIVWSSFWRRFIKISIGALLISISTYMSFRKHWVYFGTLHCIALSSLLGLLFVSRKWLSLATGLFIIIFMYSTGINVDAVTTFINKPSMDFIPIYPWFSVVLLGICYESFKLSFLSKVAKIFPHFFIALGQKSFWIYMLHQPVLYGLSYILYISLK